MYLNIITPCSRPENLIKISESINIPRSNYRWIVVFDSLYLPDKDLIPMNCEIYTHKDEMSISGNAQRNFALNLIKEGYVYFNDDDTLIHVDLWENIKNLKNDFISFKQLNKNGTLRLEGNNIKVCEIDSHNFIVENSIIYNNIFILNNYAADGLFAEACFKNSKSYIYLNKELSIYNILR
jgi:hypothetical protein